MRSLFRIDLRFDFLIKFNSIRYYSETENHILQASGDHVKGLHTTAIPHTNIHKQMQTNSVTTSTNDIYDEGFIEKGYCNINRNNIIRPILDKEFNHLISPEHDKEYREQLDKNITKLFSKLPPANDAMSAALDKKRQTERNGT